LLFERVHRTSSLSRGRALLRQALGRFGREHGYVKEDE
jgi:hypothetical protein